MYLPISKTSPKSTYLCGIISVRCSSVTPVLCIGSLRTAGIFMPHMLIFLSWVLLELGHHQPPIWCLRKENCNLNESWMTKQICYLSNPVINSFVLFQQFFSKTLRHKNQMISFTNMLCLYTSANQGFFFIKSYITNGISWLLWSM